MRRALSLPRYVLPQALLAVVVVYGAAWFFVIRDTYQEVSVPKEVYSLAEEVAKELPPPCDGLIEAWDVLLRVNPPPGFGIDLEMRQALNDQTWVTVRCKESMSDRVKHWAPW